MPGLIKIFLTGRIEYHTPITTLIIQEEGCSISTPEQIHADCVLGILHLQDRDYLCYVSRSSFMGVHRGIQLHRINRLGVLPLSSETPCEEIHRLVAFIKAHSFFYTEDEGVDSQFVWNRHMKQSNASLLCGTFHEEEFCFSNQSPGVIKLLSLISCNKVGARLYSRGLDDAGNVSFFVETRLEVAMRNKMADIPIFEHTVLRGSVPLFWKQANTPLRTEIAFTRENEATLPAFIRHFSTLTDSYGNICVLNLLSDNGPEKVLSQRYSELLSRCGIKEQKVDLNKHTKNFAELKLIIENVLDDLPFCTLRVNCLDCLDRTNLAQFLISQHAVRKAVGREPSLFLALRRAWTDNGNVLANFYSGSGALKSELSLKGKRTLAGRFDDFMINASRIINGKFTDHSKDGIINALLGKGNSILQIGGRINQIGILAVSWCVHHRKHGEIGRLPITEDTLGVVVALQAIGRDGVLLGRRDGERASWVSYICGLVRGFVLVSQGFAGDSGILLFVRRDALDLLRNVDIIRHNIKSGISIGISFNFDGRRCIIINNKIKLGKGELVSGIEGHDYGIIMGHYKYPTIYNKDSIQRDLRMMDYSRILEGDMLSYIIKDLSDINEKKITFHPTDYSDDIPSYSDRIFYKGNIRVEVYKDLIIDDISNRAVYCKLYLI
ncbi:Polyphosphatidylinositol phosphatase INP52 [Astathelohania contejeani]|uniref:phosphoinositide 5-phosphatase n=1 Tax=Astathelohania contejeani TaxID=164912 RepID=A0ABQ7HYM3_9MICR|nr:Polyphosphatidylinositol phosphatase INP52 [Thelohania contejeani]